MATTRTWNDVIAASSHAYTRRTDDTSLEYIVNNALAKMWNAYDWRGTVADFPPFWLVPNEQDYGVPLFAVPSDFSRILEARLVFLGGSIPYKYPPMAVSSNLQVTHATGQPKTIAYKPEIAGFRLHPVPGPSYSSPNWMVEGSYKKRPPKVTTNSLGSFVLWDDQYFDALTQAFIWAARRAGPNIQAAREQEQVFYMALQEATAHENFEQGSPTIHPAEGLSEEQQGDYGILIYP